MGRFLIIIGYIAMAFGTVTSIGYGLYQLAINDLTVALAAWRGFVVWISCLGGGFLSFFAGVVALEFKKQPSNRWK